ncbi:MAG: hypothetical protein A2033_13910 [Bacteroidetes bacterium GWA2_31_9]|nr:MAG: hypothetical protein A2033_13910 [Bacteroidetes bacterium GWA2_31_9]
MKSIITAWILAIVITLSAAYYQRKTGPTYPIKGSFDKENTKFKYHFPRSCDSDKNAIIEISEFNNPENLFLKYKRFNTNDEFAVIGFRNESDKLIAELPMQPPAGKLIYEVIYKAENKEVSISEKPVVIRFKGSVPAYILVPHIIFIFLAMLLSNLSGILAIFKNIKFRFYSFLTIISLSIGGMTLGPIVQKYAFGEFWTGVPFGWDLTDNKTLIAFIFWLLAVALNLKKPRPIYVIIASIMLLIVFSIPHSMFGSELNYSSGVIGTAK